jgi:hypothetical protein
MQPSSEKLALPAAPTPTLFSVARVRLLLAINRRTGQHFGTMPTAVLMVKNYMQVVANCGNFGANADNKKEFNKVENHQHDQHPVKCHRSNFLT